VTEICDEQMTVLKLRCNDKFRTAKLVLGEQKINPGFRGKDGRATSLHLHLGRWGLSWEMSSKSRQNQSTESRLLDENGVEQRALQIARDEGRGLITEEDRTRAREELLASNENGGNPEVTPEMGGDHAAWDESPKENGTHVPNVIPDDEKSIGKELVEKGLRGPRETRQAG